jgi:death on curing protein
MDAPIFLTLDEVLQLHAYQIEHFGGDAAVLDMGLLESAIAQPQMSWQGQFLHEDLAAMAAAYLYHIVMNHAFADGNKRTGAHAAMVFLEMNNIELDYPVDEMEQLTLSTAAGQLKKDDLAKFFRRLIGGA